jgi:hypothetical protein
MYDDVLACFDGVGEDEEKSSKIGLRFIMNHNTIISFTVVEPGTTPEIIGVNAPVDLRFVE